MTASCGDLLQDYVARLTQLEAHHLAAALKQARTGEPLQLPALDSTRAFVVASYAETESFVETLALMLLARIEALVTDLEEEISANQRTSKPLAALCDKYLAPLLSGRTGKDLEAILSTKKIPKALDVEAVLKALRGKLKSCTNDISQNHGLLHADMEKLFDRVGCETASAFTELRNDLTILNTRRSQFAHSGVAAKVAHYYRSRISPAVPAYTPDPQSERQLVVRISYELTAFVNTVNAIVS